MTEATGACYGSEMINQHRSIAIAGVLMAGIAIAPWLIISSLRAQYAELDRYTDRLQTENRTLLSVIWKEHRDMKALLAVDMRLKSKALKDRMTREYAVTTEDQP